MTIKCATSAFPCLRPAFVWQCGTMWPTVARLETLYRSLLSKHRSLPVQAVEMSRAIVGFT
ncbi:hypothetical protein CCR75_001276 [Bremia lactucae]|uniref:Uncharacterized protein n=1 Tax=Bremia lactucae TaxID=4779 RepID=A0A976FMQ5_BRELC|nr:hypothetical protein CCR75_001276 [Bremia lactucae]